MKIVVPLTLLGLSLSSLAAAAPPRHLELGPCSTPGLPADARCGTYEVFENRASGTGRKIPLRVAVLPARGPDRLSDPVLYFAGGPGGGSVEEGADFAVALPQLPARRDFLLVDFRGTGGSAGLFCTELQGSGGLQDFLDDFLPAAKVRACRDRLRQTADLAQYDTDNAIDDVDEIRGALGYGKANVMGESYGTRAVLIYLRRHPEHVRTATMLGVMPTFDREPLFFARTAQNALDGLVAACAADKACAAAFPKLKEEIAAILDRAARAPVSVQLTDPKTAKPFTVKLSRNGVAQALRYMLYGPAASAQLPFAIHRAAQGDFVPLAEAARNFASDALGVADGFFLSVTCAEDLPYVKEADVPAAVAGTFLGDFRIRRQQAACDGWPAAHLGEPFLAPVVADVPSFLISGQLDPVTPASDGAAVAASLRHSRHVIVPGGGHGMNGMKGQDCLFGLVGKLVESGSVDGLDTSCVAKMERPPFQVSGGEPAVALSRAELEPLVGTYSAEKEGFTLKIDLLEDRLRATLGGDATLLIPVSPTRFRLEGMPGIVLTFARKDGPASSLTVSEPGRPDLIAVRKPG
ncbi:MAG TPA: alpha/beta fold hydrolase [Thermoanaerobaculia bacterium]|nr:alpha/beta fold hydrolase [Thermoanaerobaculia bacterium]